MVIVPKTKIETKWIPTTKPFSMIHIDFFYFAHQVFLLIVDSFSKWLEIDWMKNGTDTGKVLKKLVAYFARFGLPDVLVSDGGPPFNAYNFVAFLEKQGIKVLKSPPYNPSSNGQAERLVRTVKEVLKKFLIQPETKHMNLEDLINLFLFTFRNSCGTKDGSFPSERIFSYTPKTIVDLINPKKHYRRQMSQIPHPPVDENSLQSNKDFKPTNKLDNLMEGDLVWYKSNNPHHHTRWMKASFLKQFSINTFQVMIGNVPTMAHRSQLRVSTNNEAPPNVLVYGQPHKGQDVVVTNVDRGQECSGFEEEEEQGGGFPEPGGKGAGEDNQDGGFPEPGKRKGGGKGAEEKEQDGEIPETGDRRRSRKRKQETVVAVAAKLPKLSLRRSKRTHTRRKLDDFIYD